MQYIIIVHEIKDHSRRHQLQCVYQRTTRRWIVWYKAGAYTGATKDKRGLIELADGGTLFLDEIGGNEDDLQAKLLRVLENGEFIKLGDTKISKANIRLIAATNRDLKTAYCKRRVSRRPLLSPQCIHDWITLALRERSGDIPLLVNFFLQQFAAKQNKISL